MTAYLVHIGDPIESLPAFQPAWMRAASRLAPHSAVGVNDLQAAGARFAVATRCVGARGRASLQPAVSGRDGVVVVFDGRLHDPDRFRAIMGLGRDFDSRADAELVAEAYERFDDRMLAMLRGEFTLVIHEPRRRRTIVARDILGTRYVYWAKTEAGILVSNDLPTLRASGLVDDRLDEVAMVDFLLHGRLDYFDKVRTPFRGIHAIEPACGLIVSTDGNRIIRHGTFGDLLCASSRLRPDEIPGAFRALMREVIAERMDVDAVDVPMSGGLDSTTIAAIAMDLHRSGGARARPSARTTLASRDDRERHYAELAASHIGIEHTLNVLDSSSILAAPEAMWYPVPSIFGTPVADRDPDHGDPPPSPKPPLVLTGASADTLLHHERSTWLRLLIAHGPFHALHAHHVLRAERRSLAIGTGIFAPRSERAPLLGLDRWHVPSLPRWLRPEVVKQLRIRERLEDYRAWRPPDALHPQKPNAQFWLQLPNWAPDIVPVHLQQPRADWTDPFLDFRIISFIFSIPVEPWMHRKRLLRVAGRGLLPDELLDRPKAPAGNYFAAMVRGRYSEALNHWRMSPMLGEIIDRAAIPPIDIDAEGEVGFINLRPLMLQRWVGTLNDW